MDGQADSQLDRAYQKAVAQARRLLASRYALQECLPSSADYPSTRSDLREVWRVTVNGDTAPQDFIVAVPYTFPDVLPRIYLPVETGESRRDIPHLDRNRFLCGYDETTARPNADDPGQVALEVLSKAVCVFRAGITGSNRADFDQELEAYWGLDCTLSALSLVGPNTSFDNVVMVEVQPPWRNYSYVFGPTEETVSDWLTAVQVSSKTKAQTVPFLHLKTLGQPPLPSTNGEIHQLLAHHDQNNLSKLLSYLKNAERPSAVLFSAPIDSQNRMLGAWWHPLSVHHVNRGPAHAKRHRGVVPGFRAGTAPSASAELSLTNRQAKLIRASIERVDKTRLFARTIGASPASLEHRVNIVGCGSLGSFTAASLVQSGVVDRLKLIDPQTLDVENVQRHYCGMSYIEQTKVAAVATKLRAHFPHVDLETRDRDILEIIRSSPVDLVPASLSIVTVADIAIERRLNRVFHQTQVFGDAPICFMWVEPLMLAGHAILVRRGAGCFECVFDEQLRFEERVVSNSQEFSRREAGCQTTFVPYSGLDVSEFVVQAVRFLLKHLDSEESLVFSWIGDTDGLKASTAILQDRWKHTPGFSAHMKTVTRKAGCAACGDYEPSLRDK